MALLYIVRRSTLHPAHSRFTHPKHPDTDTCKKRHTQVVEAAHGFCLCPTRTAATGVQGSPGNGKRLRKQRLIHRHPFTAHDRTKFPKGSRLGTV
eukprot:589575-Rhodomonas_salina.1